MRILHSKKLIFVSKPRCGSTMVRQLLDRMIEPADEKCDYGKQHPILHPHMSGAAIFAYLADSGFDTSEYRAFIVTRNPLDMLWSYYRFFKPDINSLYTYSKSYRPENPMEFGEWLLRGCVDAGKWSPHGPDYISSANLSPLSLEAHINDRDGKPVVEHIFKLEEFQRCLDWLRDNFGVDWSPRLVHVGEPGERPEISPEILDVLRPQFPLEFSMYQL